MDYQAPVDEMRFLLREVFQADALWTSLGLHDATPDVTDAILEHAAQLTEQVIAPLNRPGDEQGVRWESGRVTTPEGFPAAWRTWAEGGWVGLSGNPTYGGQGLPKMFTVLVEEMLQSAGNAFCLYAILSSGAALALDAHAPEAIRQRYLPRLYSGDWAGTMCLTEAHAGTDLGIMRTRAEPQEDGSYRITGTKIFITGGEHDLTENIIHLVLARLPDAPAGPKGISLFLVPKFLVNDDDSLGARNGVQCGSVEHKMGIHASSTCVMNFDGATGWLIGEPHKGLAAMFTMMNYERLTVGIQGLGCAELAYQKARAYARERLQSRAPGGAVQPDSPADPIIAHPDVRRMLLTQKAYIGAMRALALYVGQWLDIARYSDDPVRRQQAENRVALFTPVAKAFITDRGFECCVLAQQCFGGHGYIREWGVEQLVRDARIGQIYEGTNGVQAYDLVARKVVANGGAWVQEWAQEVQETLEAARGTTSASALAGDLGDALRLLLVLTDDVVHAARQDPAAVGAASVDYLNALGLVACAYLWLRICLASEGREDAQSQGRMHAAVFFYAKLLPQLHTLAATLRAGSAPLMAVPVDAF